MAEQTAAQVEDDFDKAFADAAVAAEKQVQLDVKDTSAEDAAKAAKDAAATKTPEEIEAETEAARVAADAAAAAALAAETPEQKTAREAAEAEAKVAADAAAADAAAKQALIDAAATVKAAKEAADAEAARVAAAAETDAQKTAREAAEAAVKPYEFSEEETAAMKKMEADFPNEYAAMQAALKAAEKSADARVFKATQAALQQVYKDLAPIAANSQDAALRIHLDTIHKAHADFATVVKDIPAWIKQQPAYLQETMQKVYDGGDAQSVIDLVAGFKAAMGKTTAPAKTATEMAAEAAAATAATAKAAKDAADAAALLPVKGKRTTPTPKGAADMQDFDGAFAEAAAAA